MATAGGAAAGYDVFLSHKSEYKPWVEWLGRSLQGCGFSVFLDKWNLVPGNGWVEGLHQGVEQSRAAVLVATPDVVNSGWVRQEFDSLMRRRIQGPGFRLVPVVFGDVPHLPFLSDVQCVDARDPAGYREWFHRLICGLRGHEPGSGPAPNELLQLTPPPIIATAAAHRLTANEVRFTQQVMTRIQFPASPPILVLVRGRRHQGTLIHNLLQHARKVFGIDAMLHLTPPFSQQEDTDACFAELGRQAGLSLLTPDASRFCAALNAIFDKAPKFVLVTGFENAHHNVQTQLAGVLRSVNERYVNTARIVLIGGLNLLDMKFQTSTLSLWSGAQTQELPEPNFLDARMLQQQNFPWLEMTDEQAQQLVEISGGHAGLIIHCIETWATVGGDPLWSEWCYSAPDLWETWFSLKHFSPELMRESLNRNDFGPNLIWPINEIARRFYWSDLLKAKNGRLIWRCELMRRVGLEVLA